MFDHPYFYSGEKLINVFMGMTHHKETYSDLEKQQNIMK